MVPSLEFVHFQFHVEKLFDIIVYLKLQSGKDVSVKIYYSCPKIWLEFNGEEQENRRTGEEQREDLLFSFGSPP